jgi:hypothetical protein
VKWCGDITKMRFWYYCLEIIFWQVYAHSYSLVVLLHVSSLYMSQIGAYSRHILLFSLPYPHTIMKRRNAIFYYFNHNSAVSIIVSQYIVYLPVWVWVCMREYACVSARACVCVRARVCTFAHACAFMWLSLTYIVSNMVPYHTVKLLSDYKFIYPDP